MIASTWDRRIERAEKLACIHPAAAEPLRFYAETARFQKSVDDAIGDQSKLDTTLLNPHFAPLLLLIRRIGPQPLAQAAGELAGRAHALQDLLMDPEPAAVYGFF